MDNTQDRLSAEDQLRLTVLMLKQELLQRDSRIFGLEVQARYGRPGETLTVAPDGALLRSPVVVPVTEEPKVS